MTELVQEEMPKQKTPPNEEENTALSKLAFDSIQYHFKKAQEAMGSLTKVQQLTNEAVAEAEQMLANYAMSLKTTKIDPDRSLLQAFMKKPYILVPKKQDSWYLYIPRFIDMQVGYLEQQTEGWNKFLVNRYAEWLGGIPDALKKELGLKTPLELKLEGDLLFGTPEAQEEAWKKYRPFLRSKEKDGLKINPKTSFELIAALIKDGILPFTISPIAKDEFREIKTDFKLRPYQEEAWDIFRQYANVGIFWPPGAGKTFEVLWALGSLKGPHLIVVPQIILKEQWDERIKIHLPDLVEGVDYLVTTYQGAFKKNIMEKEWKLLAIDEAQHLPANSFINLSRIKRKYTIGLSATPQREDGREEYIFALTGRPIGLSWEFLKKSKVIKSPIANVWIVKNQEARFKKLAELLQEEKKTVVFSDSLETGRMLAARYDVPFVSGETKEDRLKTILDAPLVIVSRVGDQGVSIPDIARVIEVSWLWGSRRQEMQRFGRLLHGESSIEAEHHIIITADEYGSDKKRLFSIFDQGFKVVLHQSEGTEKIIEKQARISTPIIRARPLPSVRKPESRKESKSEEFEEEPVQQTLPLPSQDMSTLPGVQRILQRLNKQERAFYRLLVQHDGQWFRRDKLPMLLGFTTVDSMRHSIDFDKMARSNWIETQKKEGVLAYRTNMRV